MKLPNRLTLNFRDTTLRDSFTTSENFNFLTLFFLFTILTCNIDGDSNWKHCIIVLIGVSALVNVKIHEIVHPFVIDNLWKKIFYFNIPVILLLLIYCLSAFGNPIDKTSVLGSIYYYLKFDNNIFSTNVSFKEKWLLFVSHLSLFSMSTQILIIPKSLYFISKFLNWCCLSLFLVVLSGYIFRAINLLSPPLSYTYSDPNYFFYFSDEKAWATFSLIWIYASYAISTIEYEKNNEKFLKTKAPLFLALCALLASTTIILQASVASIFLSFAFSHICFMCYRYYKNKKEAVLNYLFPLLIIFGTLSIVKACLTFYQMNFYNQLHENLKATGLQIFLDNPLFGWGINCYQTLSMFYNNPYLLNKPYESIPSSFINILCEFGIIGIMVMIVYALLLYIQYYFKKQTNTFTEILFYPLFLLIILSFFQNTFSNTSVSFSFWIIGFLALRWAQLFHHRPDEVDTRENLITPDNLRKVPFITNPKKETFK